MKPHCKFSNIYNKLKWKNTDIMLRALEALLMIQMQISNINIYSIQMHRGKNKSIMQIFKWKSMYWKIGKFTKLKPTQSGVKC